MSRLQVQFSPDGRWVVSASFDKAVKLWDGVRGAFVATLRGHVGPVYQVAWSADSRLLVSASKDSTLKARRPLNLNLNLTHAGCAAPPPCGEARSLRWLPLPFRVRGKLRPRWCLLRVTSHARLSMPIIAWLSTYGECGCVVLVWLVRISYGSFDMVAAVRAGVGCGDAEAEARAARPRGRSVHRRLEPRRRVRGIRQQGPPVTTLAPVKERAQGVGMTLREWDSVLGFQPARVHLGASLVFNKRMCQAAAPFLWLPHCRLVPVFLCTGSACLLGRACQLVACYHVTLHTLSQVQTLRTIKSTKQVPCRLCICRFTRQTCVNVRPELRKRVYSSRAHTHKHS